MPFVRLMEVYSLSDWYVVPKGVSRCLLIKTKHFFFVYLWTDCLKKSCLSRSSFWLTASFLALFIVYGEMYVWQFFGDVARLSGASKVSIVVWSNIGLNSIGIILWVWVKIDLGVYMVIEKKKMKFAFI